MNKILFIMTLAVVSCVPSRTIPETVGFDRDRRWSRCSFYVVDHDCGMIREEEARDECAIDAQAEYLSQSETRQRLWLRQHGCPSHIVNPI